MNIAEKLTTIAENEPKIYEAGKKSQYDEFWDNFQDYGERFLYKYAFYTDNGAYVETFGSYWNDDTLRPKYDIVTDNSTERMFGGIRATHLKKGFEGNEDLTITLKGTANKNYMFSGAKKLVKIPQLDFSDCQYLTGTFDKCSKLVELSLIVTEKTKFDARYSYYNTFCACYSLKHLEVQGIVGSSINLGNSQVLSKDSIINLISILSTTSENQTITFSKYAVKAAFGSVDSEEWLNLISTKPNWTFAVE